MPTAILKVIGPYDEECNGELICEMCDEYTDEERLEYVLLAFKHPEDEKALVASYMNMCFKCKDNIINNSTMNRIKDTFGGA